MKLTKAVRENMGNAYVLTRATFADREMRGPDFFLVGAPKCGTSALFRYLRLHPSVYMSPVKEPNYFCLDIPQIRRPNSTQRYYDLFSRARDDQICGEASTSYLFSRVAISEIVRVDPQARIIAMVRNPIDMVVSLHGQKVYSFEENETNFERAWQLSEERAHGRRVLPTCRVPEQLDYKSAGRLGEQIKRLLSLVPREQVHIVVFDDFVADTREAFRRVLDFLGIGPLDLERFPLVNVRKENRMPSLARLLKRPPFPLDRVKEAVRQRFPAQTALMERRIDQVIRKPADKAKISSNMRREMAREFACDIDLLGRLLNRDFTHWYKGE